MPTPTLTLIYQTVHLIFALAAISTGLQAILSPSRFATSFGIPLPQPQPQPSPPPPSKTPKDPNHTAITTSYISLLGARQLGTGLTLLAFAYQGKWAEGATILAIIGVVVAGMDGWFIARNGSLGGGLYHAVPGVGIAGLAIVALLRGEGL